VAHRELCPVVPARRAIEAICSVPLTAAMLANRIVENGNLSRPGSGERLFSSRVRREDQIGSVLALHAFLLAAACDPGAAWLFADEVFVNPERTKGTIDG